MTTRDMVESTCINMGHFLHRLDPNEKKQEDYF